MTILYWQHYAPTMQTVVLLRCTALVCLEYSTDNFANGIGEEQVIISHTDLLSSNSDLLWGHRNMENLHIFGNALQGLQLFAALV